jgi:Fic family protein
MVMNFKELQQLIKRYNSLTKGAINHSLYTAYAITHHSTAIEGSTLTEGQVVNLLEYGKPAQNKPFEHQLMAYDHYKALVYVEQNARTKTPVTPELIKGIAAQVMKGTGGVINVAMGAFDVSQGDYRLCSVRAGTRQFPDYKKVPAMVNRLCADLESAIKGAKTFEQKCLLAFLAHFELVSIHPFGDGNGRTARLLMNYVQIRLGLPPSTVLKQDRLKYIDALEKARKTENLEHFYIFMLNQYGKFLKREIKSLENNAI